MGNHDRYWLSLVAEYTDLAVLKQDEGIHQDGIPRYMVKRLGRYVRKVKDRIIITAAGRKVLKGE